MTPTTSPMMLLPDIKDPNNMPKITIVKTMRGRRKYLKIGLFCKISVRQPAVDKKPLITGGVIHGIITTIFEARPILVTKYPINALKISRKMIQKIARKLTIQIVAKLSLSF
ncbi:hypothetical protein [Lactovum odontotermitis]